MTPRSILAQWRGFSETLFLKHEENTFLRTGATMYTIGWCCYVVRRRNCSEWKVLFFFLLLFALEETAFLSFFSSQFILFIGNRNNFSWRVIKISNFLNKFYCLINFIISIRCRLNNKIDWRDILILESNSNFEVKGNTLLSEYF